MIASHTHARAARPTRNRRAALIGALAVAMVLAGGQALAKGTIELPSGGIGVAKPGQVSTVIQLLLLITVISLAPAILMMMTCFTRIVIVLSFLRRALGTQQLPPDQIIVGLALFLTFAIMSPVFGRAYRDGIGPYLAGEGKVSQEEAFTRTIVPFRSFMFRHVRPRDLKLFISMDESLRDNPPRKRGDVPTLVLIPSFVLSELRLAFWMGFLLYLPFLIIDLVVSSVLMSMGILFLPPVIISLPFKVLLFVMVDGWYLVVGELVRSFG